MIWKEAKSIYDVDKEINRIRKAIHNYRELSSKLNDLRKLKTDIGKKIDALKQIFSHVEEVKDEVKLKIKELKSKTENILKENLFDFTEYVKKQEEYDEIDLGLFLELAEGDKNIYNQVLVNTLIEVMEKLKNGFFTNG